MARIVVESGPFLAGLAEALKDFDHQAAEIVDEVGGKVVSLARGFAPHGATGEIEAGLGVQSGRNEKGPYVDVGVLDPPSDRHDFFQEFGTYKMKAHPYMRPALAQAGAALRAAGARTSLKGRSSLRKRAAMRERLRRAARQGRITSTQARAASRQLSRIKASRLRSTKLRIG